MKITLELKATLENIKEFYPSSIGFRWYLKTKCTNCCEESIPWQYISVEDLFPLQGSKGCANLVIKCKYCGKTNSLSIISDSIKKITNDEEFQSIVKFDCRGLELIDFSPRDGWKAKCTNSDTIFDVDLTEFEWSDYDEQTHLPIGIYNIEYRFISNK